MVQPRRKGRLPSRRQAAQQLRSILAEQSTAFRQVEESQQQTSTSSSSQGKKRKADVLEEDDDADGGDNLPILGDNDSDDDQDTGPIDDETATVLSGVVGFLETGTWTMDTNLPDAADLALRLNELAEGMDVDLPQDVDLEDMQQRDQYEDPMEDMTDTVPQGVFAAGEDESEVSDQSTHLSPAASTTESSMLPPSIIQSAAGFEDKSTPIVFDRLIGVQMQPFELAVGLFCEETSMSRSQYRNFRDILRMLEPNDQIQHLPETLDALRRSTRGQIPLLPMSETPIILRPEKLPSAAESRKRTSTGAIEMSMPFFELEDLIKRFLSSNDFSKKVFKGLGEFRDMPLELYQSHAWLSSIRTTSGQYAHFSDGEPMFPSDVVTFKCDNQSCGKVHWGRVHEVGRDYRSSTPQDKQGEITVRLRELLPIADALRQPQVKELLASVTLLPNEYILTSKDFMVEEANVKRRYDGFWFDYISGDTNLSNETHAANKQPPWARYVVRYLLTVGAQPNVRPLAQTSPLRAELELAAFKRAHFRDSFDVQRSAAVEQCVSVPLQMFIDGFGLYRNSYRSLMGIYIMMAGLKWSERSRRANVLPLTLGPHGSFFEDVVKALQKFNPLDAGAVVDIDGKKTFLCVFVMSLVGDMPQQQMNAGFKTQRATLGCRFCLVVDSLRADLDYDVLRNGRYHHQAEAMRKERSKLTSKAKKATYSTKMGLSDDPAPIRMITPALDHIMSTPGDPAHSEYNGQSRQLHFLLVTSLLTPTAVREYATVLRSFPFPPGYARLQSPVHHLKSYSLSDHARWSIIAPCLLRCWLRRSHINTNVVGGLGPDPVSTIINCFAVCAKSNNVLMSQSLSLEDHAKLGNIVKEGRQSYQDLLEKVAAGLETRASRTPSRAGTPSRAVSRAGTPSGPASPSTLSQADITMADVSADTPAGDEQALVPLAAGTKAERGKLAKAYRNDRGRPNVHTALHYERIAEEYGLPVNSNVLIFEDKHRFFKKIVYSTNHSQVERAMLIRENMQQTCRLLLLDAFKEENADVTKLFHRIHSAVPHLFDSLLPRSEKEGLLEELTAENEQSIEDDTAHRRASAIGAIDGSHCKCVMKVPTLASRLDEEARDAVSAALTASYGIPNVLHFKGPVNWCKKFSFFDPETEQRVTFKVGDFVQLVNQSIVRIDQLLTMTVSRRRLLFANVSETAPSQSRDMVLDLPMCSIKEPRSKWNIVGMPDITARRLYMLPVETDSSSGDGGQVRLVTDTDSVKDLIHVTWTLQWL